MVAITAQDRCKMLKTDTKQAFLNGEIGDEKIFFRPPDWWPEPVPQGHAVYQRGNYNGLDGFADSAVSHVDLQQDCWHDTTNYRVVEIKNAEDDCAVNCGSRILFSI